MLEIANNIVLVKGFNRGAIYNLNNGEVYSINREAIEIIEKYNADSVKNVFLDSLMCEGIFDYKFQIHEYIPAIEEKSKIELAWLEITQSCNMRCVHCYEGNVHYSGSNLLNLSEWKKVIDELYLFGVKRIVIIGGEPCIHKDIIEIIKYVHSYNMDTTLFTNAYYLQGDLLKTVISTNTKLKISLYGHKAEIHDRITGVKGSFDKLINAVQNLENNNIDVHIAITIMKENEEYIDEIKNFVKSLHVQGYKFDVIREVVCGTQNQHIPTNNNSLHMAYRWKPNFYVKKKQFDSNATHNSCWNGKLVISENGDVLPCVFARNHIVANIKTEELEKILNDNLQSYWNLPLSQIETCKDCEYRYACKDCRPLSEASGNYLGKNPRCKYDPYTGVWENESN